MSAEIDQEGMQDEQNLERHMRQLEDTIKLLESDDCPITEAITRYTEGMKLALYCRRDLNRLTRRMMSAREEAFAAFKKLEEEEAAEQAEWMANHDANAPWNPQKLQPGLSMGAFNPNANHQLGPDNYSRLNQPLPPNMGMANQAPGQMGQPRMNGPMDGINVPNQNMRPNAPKDNLPNEPLW